MAAAAPAAIGVASLVIGLVGAANTYEQQEKAQEDIKKAEKKAEEKSEAIAEANAQSILTETAEEQRRAQLDKKQAASKIRAKLASSGIRGVTPEAYISAFLSERDREIDWIKSSGASRADIARRGGKYIKSSPQGGSVPQLLSGISNQFSSGYSWYEQYVK